MDGLIARAGSLGAWCRSARCEGGGGSGVTTAVDPEIDAKSRGTTSSALSYVVDAIGRLTAKKKKANTPANRLKNSC